MLPTKWRTSGQRILVRIYVYSLHTALLSLLLCAGGESAVKLLTKFGLLEAAVDYATDN